MVYWGFSYGSLLGQTYASLFPERSSRIIIDVVANQFDWYQSQDQKESYPDSEKVLDGFLECIKAGENCALTAVADSKEALRDKLFSVSDQLQEQPLSVYVNNTAYGLFGYADLCFGAIFPHLYKSATWPILAQRLAQLLQGNATDVFLAYGSSKAG